MKLKELFNKAKETKMVTILDTVDEDGEITRQHLFIGDAAYPLDGMPLVDEKTLLTMMDVTEDKREGWSIHRRAGNERHRWMLADEQRTDTDASMGKLTLESNGVELRPVYTIRGMLFVTNGQLRPVKDERNIRYRLRERENEQLIIAQRGVINIGVLMPSRWANEQEAEELWQMAAAARKIADSRKRTKWKREPGQRKFT